MRRWGAVVAGALVISEAAWAQRGPAISLPSATARLSEPFTSVNSVRELSDGTVLISDDRENRIVLADFAADKVKSVGRTGAGPGEYRQAGALFGLTNDSTLMVEDNGGVWIAFARASITERLMPERTLGSTKAAMLGGFDSRGNALVVSLPVTQLTGLPSDSLAVLLHSRGTHQDLDIGRVRSPYGRAGSVGGVVVYQRRASSAVSLFVMDRAVLFPDGWIAVARLHPYRVDWRAPDGTMTKGPILLPSRAYGDPDKSAYLKREADRAGRAPRSLTGLTGWPELMPPFEGPVSPLLAATDGRLWIARTPSALEVGNRYDIVDRSGTLAGVLTLPANERVAGFGSKFVYVAVSDENGLQRLDRRPRP